MKACYLIFIHGSLVFLTWFCERMSACFRLIKTLFTVIIILEGSELWDCCKGDWEWIVQMLSCASIRRRTFHPAKLTPSLISILNSTQSTYSDAGKSCNKTLHSTLHKIQNCFLQIQNLLSKSTQLLIPQCLICSRNVCQISALFNVFK